MATTTEPIEAPQAPPPGGSDDDRSTRRMLTVTIPAPLAAIASRMTPKSRYLPVPTMRREAKAWPPTTSASVAPSYRPAVPPVVPPRFSSRITIFSTPSILPASW